MNKRTGVSRRQFLGTAATSASVLMLRPTLLRADAKDDDLRCAMIGTGSRGRGVLNFIMKSPGVRVTALGDIDAKNLAAAAEIVKDDKPALFDDYRKLLEHREIDAVFVHTPCDLHAEMFIAVLKSGRHLYAEKPIALTVPDLNAIVAAAKASGKVVQSGTQLRYANPWHGGAMAVRQGKAGKPLCVRAHRMNSGDLPHEQLWLHSVKRSGDTIVEQAVHEFDLINWALDATPVSACGFGGQSLLFEPPGRDIMDHYSVVFDYGDKRTAGYSHCWVSTKNIPRDGFEIIVYGATGAVDLVAGKIYTKPDGQCSDVPAEPKGDPNQLAVDDFFRCIREDKKPLADVETGRNCVLAALLGRKAIYEKRTVTFVKKHFSGNA